MIIIINYIWYTNILLYNLILPKDFKYLKINVKLTVSWAVTVNYALKTNTLNIYLP